MECAILEDQALLADLLKQDLQRIAGLTVVGVAHSVEEGHRLCRRHRPDLLLIDLLLPDGLGVEVAESLLQENPTARVIVLSAQCERLACSRRLHEAIVAVLDKGSAIDTLNQILRLELRKRLEKGERKRAESPMDQLTERERQVLSMIGEGFSSAEIATRLNITTLTARTHRRNITAKLGLKGPDLLLLAHDLLRDPA